LSPFGLVTKTPSQHLIRLLSVATNCCAVSNKRTNKI
jgi:hypothetical protein